MEARDLPVVVVEVVWPVRLVLLVHQARVEQAALLLVAVDPATEAWIAW